MKRFLAWGCVLAALLMAGSVAWADEGSVPAGAAASPEGPLPAPAGGGEVAPPVITAEPEQGGALLGETLGVGASAEMVQRAVKADAFRSSVAPWQGQVRLRYRFRSTTEANQVDDHDIYGYLKLKYRDEMMPGWSGSFHGRATLDVGDFGSSDSYYAFDSITDSYENRVNGRVYHAYVNYRRPGALVEEVRVGRMYSDVGEYLHFDGARVTSRPFGGGWWQLSAFGGVPSHLFESSPSGDWTAGVSIQGRPTRCTDVRLDYTYVNDDNSYYGYLGDHLVNLTVNQRIGMNTLLRGTYQHLDEDPRLARLTFDSLFPGPDLTVRGYFTTLFTRQDEVVYDFDYYYAVALALEPYWMGNLSVSKGIGEYFSVEGGVTGRQLYDAADEGRYNREFGQYYVTVASYDWLLRDLQMSVSGEWWNSDDDVWTVTFDVDWKPCENWRLRFGTDYAAYRFDMYADAERRNDFGGYVRVSWLPTPRWRVDLRLRVDDDDYGTWTTLDAGVAFDF